MRAMTIRARAARRAHARRGRAPRADRRRGAGAGRRGRRQPDRREDAGGQGRFRRAGRVPGDPRRRLQRGRGRGAVRGTRCSRGPRSTAWRSSRAPVAATPSTSASTRSASSASRRALARGGGRGSGRRAHRVGHGRRDREGARGPAHPDPCRAGGVGHFAVQFASYFGAHVIATGSQRNHGWLRELGAAEVIDYATERFEDRASDVDVVIDLIGNVKDDTGTRSLSVLRPGGLLVNAPERQLADDGVGCYGSRRARDRLPGRSRRLHAGSHLPAARIRRRPRLRRPRLRPFGRGRSAPRDRGGAHPRQDRAQRRRGLQAARLRMPSCSARRSWPGRARSCRRPPRRGYRRRVGRRDSCARG